MTMRLPCHKCCRTTFKGQRHLTLSQTMIRQMHGHFFCQYFQLKLKRQCFLQQRIIPTLLYIYSEFPIFQPNFRRDIRSFRLEWVRISVVSKQSLHCCILQAVFCAFRRFFWDRKGLKGNFEWITWNRSANQCYKKSSK